MGLSIEDKKQYLEDSQSREAVYIRQIEALYAEARDGVTNDALSFFNSRRYLNAKDDNARARAAKSDKGIKGISAKIQRLGADTLSIINKAQIKHYDSEGRILTSLWTESTQDFFTMSFSNASIFKQRQILAEFYMGKQYPEWQKSATTTAMNSWTDSSRSVMSSNVRRIRKVLPSMQLTEDLRKTITTMENRAKSLMDGALSETVRILIKDTQASILKAEKELARRLQQRALKWV